MKTIRIWTDDGAVFEQHDSAIVWVINHWLARWPRISAVDCMGRALRAETRHVNANTAILLLDRATTGRAFID